MKIENMLLCGVFTLASVITINATIISFTPAYLLPTSKYGGISALISLIAIMLILMAIGYLYTTER